MNICPLLQGGPGAPAHLLPVRDVRLQDDCVQVLDTYFILIVYSLSREIPLTLTNRLHDALWYHHSRPHRPDLAATVPAVLGRRRCAGITLRERTTGRYLFNLDTVSYSYSA